MREKKIWRKQGILFYMVMDIFISVILLFVGIAILVVIHVCVVGRTFGREYNSGGTSVEAQRTIRRPSMSQDEIKKLPCFEYEMDHERENTSSGAAMAECAVCLESFKVGEKCRLLPNCKHSFHSVCVDSWLLKTGACPICRTGVESPKMTGHSSETEIELT